jgi:hypothetical protein
LVLAGHEPYPAVAVDPAYSDLIDQHWSFPAPARLDEIEAEPLSPGPDLATALRLRTERGVLSFIYTATVFGSAVEVTLSGLTIESFFPADRETATIFRRLGDATSTPGPAEGRQPSARRSE